jgi:excisionase family DNA binding protein
MSIPEAGRRYLDVGENTAYRLAAEGKIPFIEAGRKKRVPVAAMEALLRSVCVKPAI